MEFRPSILIFYILASICIAQYYSPLKEIVDTTFSSNFTGPEPYFYKLLGFQLQTISLQSRSCIVSLVEVEGYQVGVTTATCLGAPFKAETLEPPLVLAGLDFRKKPETIQFRRAVRAITHEDYDFEDVMSAQNNIAIVFIDAPFHLSENLKASRLPEKFVEPEKIQMTTGFNPEEEMQIPIVIEIEVLADSECKEAWDEYSVRFVADEMFCAQKFVGDPSGLVCAVDGLPVVNGTGHLTGLVSNSRSLCQHDIVPPIYTQVSHFVDWIQKKVATYKKPERKLINKLKC